MKTLSFLLLSLMLVDSAQAAYQPIIRSFHSVRTAGMGDVRYTTGLYEENFFANPARMAANPESRFQLPKISLEVGSNAISTLGTLTSGNNGLSAAANSVGKPLSARFQMILPAYYKREFLNDMWSLAIGMNMAASTSAVVSQTGYIDPITMINIGPAFTIARRLLPEHPLSVGLTMHTEFRATSSSVFSIKDFLAGTDLGQAVKGGSGMGMDFDLGSSFKPEWQLLGMQYELGFAINNLLGGKYNNMGGKLSNFGGDPFPSPRSFNLGISATHKDWGIFDQVLFAIEATDIGNNVDGSIFRTLHLGTEARWSKLAARLGLNQGYVTAGFGVDLGYFDLNLATYGEEMGLNAGTMEDRRYALQFGFHI